MTNLIRKDQVPIIIFNAIAILIFSILFIARKNYEFMIYVAVIIFFGAVLILTNKKVQFPNSVLWGLTLWAFFHMAGGALFFQGTRWYSLILIPLVGEPYNILRYDQAIHALGFGVATLCMFHLIRPILKKTTTIPLLIVIVMAGLGAGALNEIVEFLITVALPQTGIGGYTNTSLDLVANFIGAMVVGGWIIQKEKKKK